MRSGAAVLLLLLSASVARANVIDAALDVLYPLQRVLVAGPVLPEKHELMRITPAEFESLLLHPDNLGFAKAAFRFEKPHRDDGQTVVSYRLMKRIVGGVESGAGVMTFRMEKKRWRLVKQTYETLIRPRQEAPFRVGGDVKAPVVINRVEPAYTAEALASRISGIVIVEAIIDRTGHVSNVEVLKPLPFGLDQAAVDAVRKWTFRPATLNGDPVDVIFNLTINFKLKEPKKDGDAGIAPAPPQ
jgi:TonB family protein